MKKLFFSLLALCCFQFAAKAQVSMELGIVVPTCTWKGNLTAKVSSFQNGVLSLALFCDGKTEQDCITLKSGYIIVHQESAIITENVGKKVKLEELLPQQQTIKLQFVK